jgi:diguanylate cyclase (GGDEF)-like protein
VLAALYLLAMGCATALAQPAVPLADRMPGVDIGARVDLLEDPGRSLTLGEVRRAAAAGRFSPAPANGVNLGYRDAAVWIRIRVDSRNARGPWLLEVGYPVLDRVELHSLWSERPSVSGDQVPRGEKARLDRHLLFDLPVATGEDEFFLRVDNGGSMNVPLRIWDPESFAQWRRDESFVLGGYYGLLAALVLYNLILYAIVRDRAYAAYCIYVTAMGLVIAVDNGYAHLYLFRDSPLLAHWAQLSSAPFCSAMAAWFTREYLDTGHQVPRVDRVLQVIFWIGLGMLPFVTMMPRFAIWVGGQGVGVATLAAMSVAGMVAWHRGYRPARYYTIAFAALVAGALLLLLRNVSLLPAGIVTNHGIQLGSALEVLLLSMGLADRINQLRADKQRAQREAYDSQAAMVGALRETERELEARVAERTAALEELNRRMHHQAQHDALTGLPNRWLLRDRLEQAAARAKRDRGTFAVLMIDLDNFKAVNDSLGHDVGDLLLVEVAKRLADCMRERDTVARQGGDEFVAVLEDLAAPEDSALVAAKIIEALAAPVHAAGELLRTSPSIGISLYPGDGQDPDFLLKFADIAMYRAKGAGRNCYRFYADPAPLHAYEKAPG